MTAQEQMRKMLDELMGTSRDGEAYDDGIRFTDPQVCKSYLMGLCPYDLFHNTKLDLGMCNKHHSAALKADFEIAAKDRDFGYDADQLEHLTTFIRDCDRKVAVNKRRLEETQDQNDTSTEAQAVHDLNEQIGKKLAVAEELGAAGKVEESMAIMQEVDDLKQQKRKAEDIYRGTIPASATQQQKLRVCEICAAYLSLYDNDRRLADHFGGKLHMGFIKIRDRVKELETQVATKREVREQERIRRREERDRGRIDQREKGYGREADRGARHGDRYGSRRERSRSRSRSRDRKYSRSGGRRDRDRSRDKDRHRSSRRSRSRSR